MLPSCPRFSTSTGSASRPRASSSGRALDNARVLDWIIQRATKPEADNYVDTPIGYVPKREALNLQGVKVDNSVMDELLRVDKADWAEEAVKYEKFLDGLNTPIPEGIQAELNELKKRTAN